MSVDKPDTRQEILRVAGELFAARGYAGASLADVAQRLQITKAALYYHFPSKSAILDGLLAAPLAGYTALAERAATGTLSSAELLAAVIDTTCGSRLLVDLLGNDPSVRASVDTKAMRAASARINETIVAALAGPDPTPAALVRAHAAYTVAKLGTLNLLSPAKTRLDDVEHAELLAAARRALGPEPAQPGSSKMA